jgi:hypothetical protein
MSPPGGKARDVMLTAGATSAQLVPDSDWTQAEPGSLEKMRVMAMRAAAGFLVSHPWDRRFDMDRGVVVEGPDQVEVRERPIASSFNYDELPKDLCADWCADAPESGYDLPNLSHDLPGRFSLPSAPTWPEIHEARLTHSGRVTESK